VLVCATTCGVATKKRKLNAGLAAYNAARKAAKAAAKRPAAKKAAAKKPPAKKAAAKQLRLPPGSGKRVAKKKTPPTRQVVPMHHAPHPDFLLW
jgi:hypothetical protein